MRTRSFGGSSRPFRRPAFRRGNFPRRARSIGERIDPSRFINKAVITEEVENFVPEHAFQDFKLDQRLKQAIAAKNYKIPTPIQDRAIPYILNGSDVVGVADTG